MRQASVSALGRTSAETEAVNGDLLRKRAGQEAILRAASPQHSSKKLGIESPRLETLKVRIRCGGASHFGIEDGVNRSATKLRESMPVIYAAWGMASSQKPHSEGQRSTTSKLTPASLNTLSARSIAVSLLAALLLIAVMFITRNVRLGCDKKRAAGPVRKK